MILYNWFLVDYIFIIKADVDLNINPNEVMSYKYVTKDELKEMFATQSNYHFFYKKFDKNKIIP